MKFFLLASICFPLSLMAMPSFAATRCGSVQLIHTFTPPYVIKNQFSLEGPEGVFLTGANDEINEELFAEGKINDDRNNHGIAPKEICVEGKLAGTKPVDTMTVESVRDAE